MGATGFEGSTLTYTLEVPSAPSLGTVTPFTEQPGQDAEYTIFGGTDVGSINVDNNKIRFAVDSGWTVVYSTGEKLTISDTGLDDVPNITGFQFASDVPGLSTNSISFTSQSITIDVGNIIWSDGQYLELIVTFAQPHKPDPEPTRLTGTDGNDKITGTGGRDILNGLEGNDVLFAGGERDTVKGGNGDDAIGGGNHADTLYGEQGNDTVYAGDGEDSAYGGIGDDALFGGNGHDSLFGGDGNDVAWGGAGNDLLKGANGNDVLGGGGGNDDLYGGAGHDSLMGGDGNDELFGNMGSDTLSGGAGKDVLNGGLGDDVLFGGFGIDTFIFDNAEGNDVIRDFEAGRDLINLGGQTYTVSESANGDAILELSGGGSVTLFGIAIGDVNSDWILAA